MQSGFVHHPAGMNLAGFHSTFTADSQDGSHSVGWLPVKTALVVENLLRLEGLRRLLARSPEFEVVELLPSEPNLIGAVDEAGAEVVIADAVGGVERAVEIARCGVAGVILVGEHANVADARALLDLGVTGRGYLVESRLRDDANVLEAIRVVAGGGTAFDSVVAGQLAAQRRREDSSPLSRLTGREREVLSELAAGWSNAAIASSLGISKRAVERHIASIFRKCGLPSGSDESRRVAVTLLYLGSSSTRTIALS